MKRILGGICVLLLSGGAIADDGSWFRIAGGRAGVLGDNNSGSGYYGHLFIGRPGAVLGLSHSHLWLDRSDFFSPADNRADLKETSALVGWGTQYGMFVFGPSRVQIDGVRCRRDYNGADHCVGGGLAAEANANFLIGPVGIEFRLFGNVNRADKFSGLAIGLSFGSGSGLAAPVPQNVIEVRPEPPVAPPPPPRPPGAEPAPGKTAKIKPEAQARAQPKIGANGTIPAGATVTIKSSMSNNEGTWWYVEAAGQYGWARSEDLDVAP